jgi:undecaprenyl-diphosphatase
MNWLDLWTMTHVNSLVNRWWILDAAVAQTSYLTFLTGGVLMAMFWWAWVKYGIDDPEKQATLAIAVFATVPAVFVSRALAFSLPYRERPMHDPRLHYHIAYTQDPSWLIHWSAFPSDHAAVVFCIAAGLWMVSRRLGTWAIAYATLISLPRIYLGFHYPTDVLGGALIGIGVAGLAKIASLRSMARWVLNRSNRYPAWLYACLFLFTFEVGEMFTSFQRICFLGIEVCRRLPRTVLQGLAIPASLVLLLGVLAGFIWWKHRPIQEGAVTAVQHHV